MLRREDGNRQYYTANTDFLMFEEYKNIVLKTTGLGDHLRWVVRANPGLLLGAFAYGDTAAPTMPSGKAVQFCCVGDLSEKDIQTGIKNARLRTLKEYEYLHYTARDFSALRKRNDPALARLLEGDKVFVVGRPENLLTMQPGIQNIPDSSRGICSPGVESLTNLVRVTA